MGQIFSETVTFGLFSEWNSVSFEARWGIIPQEESYASSESTHPRSAPPCINNQTQTQNQIVCTDPISQPAAAHQTRYVPDITPCCRYSCYETYNSNLAETKVIPFLFPSCVIFGGNNSTIMLPSYQQNKSPRNLCKQKNHPIPHHAINKLHYSCIFFFCFIFYDKKIEAHPACHTFVGMRLH